MAARLPWWAVGMLEKPVPPRPFSVWVSPSLTLWARYDSKAAEDPTNIKFIAFLPPPSCHCRIVARREIHAKDEDVRRQNPQQRKPAQRVQRVDALFQIGRASCRE